MWYGTSLRLAVAQGANTRNSSTCKRESLSARMLHRPGMWDAVKLILNLRHANTSGRSKAMIWGSRDVCLLMIGTRASLSVKKHTLISPNRAPYMYSYHNGIQFQNSHIVATPLYGPHTIKPLWPANRPITDATCCICVQM